MTVLEWIFFAVAIPFAGLSVAALPTHWRGENTFFETETPAWWLWGDWFWRGLIRSAPTIVVGFALAIFALPVALLLPMRSTAQYVAVAVSLGGLGLAFVIAAFMTLFGRPRFLIPRHLRGGQGRQGGVTAR
jgi:hypothetical protein